MGSSLQTAGLVGADLVGEANRLLQLPFYLGRGIVCAGSDCSAPGGGADLGGAFRRRVFIGARHSTLDSN